MRQRFREEIETLVGAIHFFTRLSVPGRWAHDGAILQRAIVWYPVVGAVVGGGAALIYALTFCLWPKTLAVLAALVFAILATGALHEDGWTDMVGGFAEGGGDRDAVLNSMRQSQLGGHGAVALTVLLVLRFALLVETDSAHVAPLLIAAHAFSRLCAAGVLVTLDYARPDGKAKPFANRIGLGDALLLGVGGALPMCLLPLPGALLAGALAVTMTLWLSYRFRRRLGGYTGDCIGAVQQVAEIAVYVGVVAGAPL